MKLRLRPINGDTLYAEVGAAATPASHRLDPTQPFETADLRVSFLAVDSTGQHETGEPVEWTNRITLKSRQYPGGEGSMVEIRAAPAGTPIRYSTDGSDPRISGGAYDGPFAVPEGSRLVLAIAEKDGVASDLHRRDIAETPVDRPIDRAASAVWTPAAGMECAATRATYDLIGRVKRHAALIGGLRVTIQTEGRTGAAQTWSELSPSDDIELTGDELERIIEALRSLVAAGEVAVDAKRLRFETGQRFLDYVADAKSQYERDDVTP